MIVQCWKRRLPDRTSHPVPNCTAGISGWVSVWNRADAIRNGIDDHMSLVRQIAQRTLTIGLVTCLMKDMIDFTNILEKVSADWRLAVQKEFGAILERRA